MIKMFLIILAAVFMLAGTSTLLFDSEWLHLIGACLYFLGPVIMIFGIPLSLASDENSDNSDESSLNTTNSEETTNRCPCCDYRMP